MKLEKAAILTCSTCGVEGDHELLYLSDRLEASRCANCGKTQVYSGRIYSEYVRDMFERTMHLPSRLTEEAFENPTKVASWPLKAFRKPFRILAEIDHITTLGAKHRAPRRPIRPTRIHNGI